MTTAISHALDELSVHVDPERIVTGDGDLEAASTVWNGAVRHRPALVVRCATTAEVSAAVRTARSAGLPLSVRGGGHDWAGRAIREGGLVVDLSLMRQVSVDGRVATVAGGATTADVAEAADRHGLTAITGTVGSVGMAGVVLGGGYGPLSGSFGLAADNLLTAEVVLGDGRVVRTEDDPDLLWALRGGGGNFGAVTSLRVALHPVTELLVGSYTFPGDQIAPVLTGLAALLERTPDGLNVVVTIASAPSGDVVAILTATWCGAAEEGRQHLDEVAALGVPVAADTTSMSPLTKLRLFDGAFPDGASYAIRTRNVAAFTPEVVSSLLDAFRQRTAPGTFVNVHHLHGAATRTPVASAAFGVRVDHHMVELIESGRPGDATLSDWPRRATRLLEPHALPGGYPNLLGPDDLEQAAAAYGSHGRRLLAVKDRLDPENIFTATPLPADPGRRNGS